MSTTPDREGWWWGRDKHGPVEEDWEPREVVRRGVAQTLIVVGEDDGDEWSEALERFEWGARIPGPAESEEQRETIARLEAALEHSRREADALHEAGLLHMRERDEARASLAAAQHETREARNAHTLEVAGLRASLAAVTRERDDLQERLPDAQKLDVIRAHLKANPRTNARQILDIFFTSAEQPARSRRDESGPAPGFTAKGHGYYREGTSTRKGTWIIYDAEHGYAPSAPTEAGPTEQALEILRALGPNAMSCTAGAVVRPKVTFHFDVLTDAHRFMDAMVLLGKATQLAAPSAQGPRYVREVAKAVRVEEDDDDDGDDASAQGRPHHDDEVWLGGGTLGDLKRHEAAAHPEGRPADDERSEREMFGSESLPDGWHWSAQNRRGEWTAKSDDETTLIYIVKDGLWCYPTADASKYPEVCDAIRKRNGKDYPIAEQVRKARGAPPEGRPGEEREMKPPPGLKLHREDAEGGFELVFSDDDRNEAYDGRPYYYAEGDNEAECIANGWKRFHAERRVAAPEQPTGDLAEAVRLINGVRALVADEMQPETRSEPGTDMEWPFWHEQLLQAERIVKAHRQPTGDARPHKLTWNGTEWVAPCGCRYHPDDDNGSHGGAPHVHRCEKHRRAATGDDHHSPAEVETYASAAENALNLIAKACGFTREWDYPLQVVRDVEDRMRELGELRTHRPATGDAALREALRRIRDRLDQAARSTVAADRREHHRIARHLADAALAGTPCADGPEGRWLLRVRDDGTFIEYDIAEMDALSLARLARSVVRAGVLKAGPGASDIDPIEAQRIVLHQALALLNDPGIEHP